MTIQLGNFFVALQHLRIHFTSLQQTLRELDIYLFTLVIARLAFGLQGVIKYITTSITL